MGVGLLSRGVVILLLGAVMGWGAHAVFSGGDRYQIEPVAKMPGMFNRLNRQTGEVWQVYPNDPTPMKPVVLPKQ